VPNLPSGGMKRSERVRSLLLILLLSALLQPSASLLAAEAPAPLDLQQLTLRIYELTNQERAKASLSPLAWSPDLQAVATLHSLDMAARHYLGHINPEGETPTDRGKRAGYSCRHEFGNHFTEGLAENLFQNHRYSHIHHLILDGMEKTVLEFKTPEEIARSTVAGWMASENHRHNILDATFGATGIGIAIDNEGRIYITQLFC